MRAFIIVIEVGLFGLLLTDSGGHRCAHQAQIIVIGDQFITGGTHAAYFRLATGVKELLKSRPDFRCCSAVEAIERLKANALRDAAVKNVNADRQIARTVRGKGSANFGVIGQRCCMQP